MAYRRFKVANGDIELELGLDDLVGEVAEVAISKIYHLALQQAHLLHQDLEHAPIGHIRSGSLEFVLDAALDVLDRFEH